MKKFNIGIIVCLAITSGLLIYSHLLILDQRTQMTALEYFREQSTLMRDRQIANLTQQLEGLSQAYALSRLAPPTLPTVPAPYWCTWHSLTFEDMQAYIKTHGLALFEDITGLTVAFSTPDQIISLGHPHVLANTDCNIQVLFTHMYGWGEWRVIGHTRWGNWNVTPELTRGRWHGRRYVEEDILYVQFHQPVDWGGHYVSDYAILPIRGAYFATEFIYTFNKQSPDWQLELLDMWIIGDRLYIHMTHENIGGTGSAGGFNMSGALYKTVFSIPFVDELAILFDGQRGLRSDHIGFPLLSRRYDASTQQFLQLP